MHAALLVALHHGKHFPSQKEQQIGSHPAQLGRRLKDFLNVHDQLIFEGASTFQQVS